MAEAKKGGVISKVEKLAKVGLDDVLKRALSRFRLGLQDMEEVKKLRDTAVEYTTKGEHDKATAAAERAHHMLEQIQGGLPHLKFEMESLLDRDFCKK